MSLARCFAQLRERRATAFCPYFPVGYPTVETSLGIAAAASAAGAHIIEVGIPFSDPLADGPTIQAASQRALEGGVRVADAFAVARAIREAGEALPVLMSYYNPIHRVGNQVFLTRAAEAGAVGLIVPDLPAEEAGDLRREAALAGLDLIAFIAPTTPEERIVRIAREATGFLYLVGVTGVTGARSELPADLADYLARVRVHTELPRCVGFGIATPEQARAVAQEAEGVIVGSALVSGVGRAWVEGERAVLAWVKRTVRDFRAAVDS